MVRRNILQLQLEKSKTFSHSKSNVISIHRLHCIKQNCKIIIIVLIEHQSTTLYTDTLILVLDFFFKTDMYTEHYI